MYMYVHWRNKNTDIEFIEHDVFLKLPSSGRLRRQIIQKSFGERQREDILTNSHHGYLQAWT